jgi:hypothetical protein
MELLRRWQDGGARPGQGFVPLDGGAVDGDAPGGDGEMVGAGVGVAGVVMVTVTVAGAIATTVMPDGSDGTTVTLWIPGPMPATSTATTRGTEATWSRSADDPYSVRITELTGIA